MQVSTLMIDGDQFAVIPWGEYQKLVSDQPHQPHQPEAVTAPSDRLRRAIRTARSKAGLTQAQLAKRLRITQATVSRAEAGRIRVSDAYLRDVMRVCGVDAT